jgi:hypothetical protein
MTYWFVQSQPELKSLKFTYNAGLHEQPRRDLSGLLNQLTDWLRRYEKGEEFPIVSDSANCDFCQYGVRCERTAQTREVATNADWMPNLANIQEVSL